MDVVLLLDANVIISGLRFTGAPRRLLETINKGNLAGFTSGMAMREIENVLLGKFKVTPVEWMLIDEGLRDTLVIIPTQKMPVVSALRDKRDLHILAAAETCAADYVVSGDKDLLILGRYKNIPILQPDDFLRQLDSQG